MINTSEMPDAVSAKKKQNMWNVKMPKMLKSVIISAGYSLVIKISSINGWNDHSTKQLVLTGIHHSPITSVDHGCKLLYFMNKTFVVHEYKIFFYYVVWNAVSLCCAYA